MQNSTWFDQNHYMSLKLAQMQATDPSYTMFKLEKAIADAGFTPYEHFVAYGADENLSPNPFFNTFEYLEAKANQLNTAGGSDVWSAASVLSAIESAGMNPWEHYAKYGSAEGVNPSNNFDEATYLSLKLAQLQRDEPKEWADKTEADVLKAFEDAGLSSLDHYTTYGKNENVVSDPSQLVTKNPVTPAPESVPTSALTAGIDNVVGSSANELITGDADTWTIGDSIDGGKGVDTLRLSYAGDIVKGDQTVKNVEKLEVSERTATDWAGDVTDFAGLQNVSVRGGKDVTLTAGASVTDVTVASSTGVVAITGDGVNRLSVANVAGNVTLTNAKDHALTLNLDNVGLEATASVISDVTASSVAVTANGAASHVDLEIDAAKNLDITGTSQLTIGNDLTGNALESINAGAFTGDLTITDTLGDVIAFTGGAGKDVVTVGATTKQITTGKGEDTVNLTVAALGKDGLVDAGEGRDTLGLGFANAVTAIPAITSQVKNFEILHLEGNTAANATVDMSKFNNNNAIDTVVVDASTKAFSLTNLADKSTVQLNGTMAEAVTLQVKDAGSLGHTTDMLNLILGDDGVASTLTGALVVSDLETLNITSQGLKTNLAAASDDNVISSLTGLSSNATVNIAGGTDLQLTTGNMGVGVTFNAKDFTGNLTLDASANSKDVAITGGTGNDTFTGGTGNDTILGGAGNDTFKSSAGKDTLTGGEGKDSFVFSSAAHSTLAMYDAVADFKHGEDRLDLAGVSGVKLADTDLTKVQTAVAELSGSASLNDALNAAAKAVDTANGVMWFEFAGNTYVYQESATGQTEYKAGDMVLELAGTSLGITTDDIVFA